MLEKAQVEQLFMTGLLYYEEPRATLPDTLQLVQTPLVHLNENQLRPSQDTLNKLMQGFM